MMFYRCKCGESTAYGSMPPYPCDSCSKCGSDLALHPDHHQEPKPHDMRPTTVATDAGPAILTRCGWCGKTKAQIEEEAADA